MNEVQVIALAGLFQSAALVRSLAISGTADAAAFDASIASVLRIDADTPADVFGGIDGVRLGLRTLIHQIDESDRDLAITQLGVSILRLERKLARRAQMRATLLDGIVATQRQADHLGNTHASVLARLSELYVETLSQLRPRVVVQGNPLHLSQPAQVEKIRATLLAGVRAAVLWRQLGGNHWLLILRRRQYGMLARGLLARCTIGTGS
jgi:high frequency lysogenization protein